MRWQWFVILATVFAAHAPMDATAQRFGGRFRAGGAGARDEQRSKPEKFAAAPKDPEQWVGMKVMPRTPTAAFGLQEKPTGYASDVSPWPQTIRKVSGHWLWIESAVVSGWINAQDVVPLADAIGYFNHRIARRAETWDLYMRGSALRDQERFDETYKDFKALEKIEEKEFAALAKQVNVQIDKRDYRHLIATTTRMARLIPSNPTIYTARGEAYLALNDRERAKADFDHAVELAASTETYSARASFYERQGQIAQAIEDLDKAIYHWPLIRLYEERAKCLILQKEYARAIADLNVALQHSAPKVENYLLRARAQLAGGHAHEANVDFATATRLAPKAETYLQIAECRYDCGQLALAIDDSSLAIRLDPKLAAAYTVRGRAQADLRREDEALADFDVALRVKRWGDADTYLSRAQLRWRRAEVDQCLADVRDAIRLGLRTTSSLLLKAAAQVAQGDHKSAIDTLDVTIQRNPFAREAYELRSVANWIAGNEQQALSDCSEAQQLAKNDSRRQFSMKKPVDQLLACPSDLRRAVFLSDVGLRPLAIELADEAIRRRPSETAGYRVRGATYFSQSDYRAARQDFEDVLARDPNDAESQAKQNYCRLRLDSSDEVIAEMNRQLGLQGPGFSAFYVRAWALCHSRQLECVIEDTTDALTFAEQADPIMVADCYLLRSLAETYMGHTDLAKADREQAEALIPGIIQRWDHWLAKQAREQLENSAMAGVAPSQESGGDSTTDRKENDKQSNVWDEKFSLDSTKPGGWRGPPKLP